MPGCLYVIAVRCLVISYKKRTVLMSGDVFFAHCAPVESYIIWPPLYEPKFIDLLQNLNDASRPPYPGSHSCLRNSRC